MKIKLNKTDEIDLSTLIDTRLLVQANSGGGKSWLLRRILEQSHGKVQQIILDLEGEFSTLREKYDYILAGKEGDIAVDVKSAGLLAKKILELNVSAIIDLYELNHQDRKEFVRRFLTGMVNAPKDLWHPCLVVIDEAHVFCPEKGQSVASEAVIDLATRGRKRGYCAILATQRLSKLHKDAAAECNNKLIGRTGLDIDRKRAAEELGFTIKDQDLSLRTLESGEFFAFGPAISKEVIQITVGDVQTTHPKAGSRILAATIVPPTEKIKKILNQLSDLPAVAKQEEETLESLHSENERLKHEIELIDKDYRKPAAEEIQSAVSIVQGKMEADFDKEREEWQRQINNFFNILEQIEQLTKDVIQKKNDGVYKDPVLDRVSKDYSEEIEKFNRESVKPLPIKFEHNPDDKVVAVTGGALRMLKVLVSRYPMTFTKSQLALLSKLSPRSGTYGTYLSMLRGNGLINVEKNGYIQASGDLFA